VIGDSGFSEEGEIGELARVEPGAEEPAERRHPRASWSAQRHRRDQTSARGLSERRGDEESGVQEGAARDRRVA
jgi:hypothetical protein